MNSLSDVFKKLKPWQKYMLGVIVVAAIGIYVVLQLDTSGEKKLLYNDLGASDSSAIVQELVKMGVEYESLDAGATIMVQSDNVSALRIALAAQHLPSSGTPGLESLESSSIGDTKADKDRKYERALKGQLENDLVRGIEPISRANVQLSVAETPSLFQTTTGLSKATIAVSMKPGMHLTDVQVSGIQNFVSGAVKNMEAKDVVIVDDKGNILSDNTGTSASSSMAGLSKQQQIIEQTENRIKNDIIASLAKVYGYDHVTLNVRANINFDEVVRNIEKYDPEGTIISRERETETAEKNSTGADPTAGVDANGEVPGYANVDGENTPELVQNSEKIIENFDVGKTVETIKQNPSLTNLNVVAWIDKTMGEQELAALKSAIATAAGLRSLNGDANYNNGTVEVMSVTFNQNTSPIVTDEGNTGNEEMLWYLDPKFYYSAISGVVVLVIIMVFILVMLSRRKKDRYVLAQAGSSAGTTSSTGNSSMLVMDDEEYEGDEMQVNKKKKQTAQDMAQQITEENPRKAAEYIRKMLREDN